MTHSPSVIPGAVDWTRFASHAERVAVLRQRVDDARITELGGAAAILECTREDVAVRRAARLLGEPWRYPAADVLEALAAWHRLYGGQR